MKEEEERQRKMIDEADQTGPVPKAELKQVKEQYMRMKNEQIRNQQEQDQQNEKGEQDDKLGDATIPAYPGASIDERGQASELTQKVHQNMVQL